MGRSRGTGVGGGNDEREQTLNQLLTEMDGFEGNTGIIVVAATNRSDILDPALLRPGRFDRQVSVDVPDAKGRLEILKVHARNKKLSDEVDLKEVAQRTPGFSGADLANLLNEAAILTGRRNKTAITDSEIDDSVDRIVAGMEVRKMERFFLLFLSFSSLSFSTKKNSLFFPLSLSLSLSLSSRARRCSTASRSPWSPTTRSATRSAAP